MKVLDSALIARWERVLKARGDATAVIDAGLDKSYTFKELDRLSRDIERQLPDRDLEGRAVVLQVPNSAVWLSVLLALRRRQAVVIPVEPSGSQQQLSAIIVHYKAAGVFNSDGWRDVDARVRKWKAASALIKLTSGTTGAPKGIVFTDEELLADASNIMSTMRITTADVNLCLHPLGHSYALGNIVMPLLGYGVGCVLGRGPMPSAVSEDIGHHSATVMPTVPAILEALIKSDTPDLAPLRLVISAAAPLSSDLAKAFFTKFGLKVHNFYGSSETGGIAYDRTGNLSLQGVGIGMAMDNVQLSHGRSKRLKVTSLAVSHYGRGMPSGKPVSVELADVVEFYPDGVIRLRGRSDRTVKLAGRRVDLDAVEQILHDSYKSTQFAVTLHGKALGVLVASKSDIINDVRKRLTDMKLGRCKIVPVDCLPRTARGKLDTARMESILRLKQDMQP